MTYPLLSTPIPLPLAEMSPGVWVSIVGLGVSLVVTLVGGVLGGKINALSKAEDRLRVETDRRVDVQVNGVRTELAAKLDGFDKTISERGHQQGSINSRILQRLDHFEARQDQYEKLVREQQEQAHRQEIRYHAVIGDLRTEVLGKLSVIERLSEQVNSAGAQAKRAHDKANDLQAAIMRKALGDDEGEGHPPRHAKEDAVA